MHTCTPGAGRREKSPGARERERGGIGMSTQKHIHPKTIHICTQARMHANTYTLEHGHTHKKVETI